MGTEAKEESRSQLYPLHLHTILLVKASLPIDEEGLTIIRTKTGEEALLLLKNEPVGIAIFREGDEEALNEARSIRPSLITFLLTSDPKQKENIAHFTLGLTDVHALNQMIQACTDLLCLRFHSESLDAHFREELIISEKVQSLFLSETFPKNLFGLLTSSFSFPSKGMDGDFTDFFPHTDHLVDIVTGDVMGKGLPAALLSTALKIELRRFASPHYDKIDYNKSLGWGLNILPPEKILEKVHYELIKPLKELEFFVSLFYGRFDFKNFTFTYVDCGSTKPLHYSAKSGAISPLKGDNFPLGIAMHGRFTSKTVTFGKSDLFLFYSDGLIKSRSPEGELFGIERLTELLKKSAQKAPEEISAKIKEELDHFTQGAPHTDEVSLLLLKIDPAALKRLTPFPNCCTFSSDPSQLPLVREFVRSFCTKLPGVGEKLSYLMEIAVNEVVTNVIMHGYSNEKNHPIIVQGSLEEDSVVFEVMDQGNAFDPSLIEEPNFSGSSDSGFGLYILRSISDSIRYIPKSYDQGYNSLKFTKQFLFNEVHMELKETTKEDVLIIKLEGDFLDAKEAPEFKKEVAALFNQKGNYNVVLDLANLNFIDSTGLGSFLSLLRNLNGLHGDLKLANMTRPIRTIFELVCMHKIFNIYSTVDEAVAAYKTASPNHTKA